MDLNLEESLSALSVEKKVLQVFPALLTSEFLGFGFRK
jgi:hypothetical protein